ncbi:hypothetical protein B7P43_G03840 [Cryptotermes secundus]|uniref:Uncharacterized protein n=1 Tax=Cryptotermes secundus TaxID=105785 RepID=A0A2J7QJX1_9NEOP|nr:hypothetical protein B7P43_G03840 [Cryptotermes secundus]
MNHMGLSLQHLLWYVDEGDVLNRTVVGKNHGCTNHQPKSKCTSMQSKHPSSHSTK